MDKIDIPSLQSGSGGDLREVLSTPYGKSHPMIENPNVLAHLKNRAADLKGSFSDGRDMDKIDILSSGERKVLGFGGSRAKIGDMKTPVYEPKTNLSSSLTYEANVAEYGPAPAGWRWKSRYEARSKGDLIANAWEFLAVLKNEPADESDWPVITPVDPPKSADSNLLRHIDDLRAKIVASQKLIAAESVK